MLVLGSMQNASMLPAQAVSQAASALDASVGRLSSGRRMVGSWDDAAGTAVSMRLAAAFKRLSATQSNLTNLHSFKEVQEESLKELGDLITRMGELKTLSSDPTKNRSDISNYSAEYAQLSAQARSISDRTFNGIRLFSATKSDQTLSVPASDDGAQTLQVVTPTLSTSTLINVICDKVYTVQTGQMEWGEAKAAAEAQGGELAKFTSSDDWDQAVFQLGTTLTQNPLWIGLSQSSSATQPAAGWSWPGGSSETGQAYQNWAAGQPDNGGVAEPGTTGSADALAFNQPATVCATFGHVGDELSSNGDGVVSGYVIQYTDSSGAIQYQAVNGAMDWDSARLAAYNPGGGVLPARAPANLGASNTTNGSGTITVTSTAGLQVGMVVTGAGIPVGTTVTGVNGLNVSLSNAATATAVGVNVTADYSVNSHLATPQSAAEYANMKTQLQAQGVGTNQVLWLGAYQSPNAANEANPAANWHWVSTTEAGDTLVHPGSDAAVSFSTMSVHNGALDNVSSGAANENVAYMSGSNGAWTDSSPLPNQGATTVTGYLMETDTITAVTIDKINQALQAVAQYRATCGSEMAAIESSIDRNQTYQTNLESAQSRIVDVDVAKETALLARNKLLMQATIRAFSQAKNSYSLLMKLLA